MLPGNRDRMRKNGFKLCQERFNLCIDRIDGDISSRKHGQSLLQASQGSGGMPALEVLKRPCACGT